MWATIIWRLRNQMDQGAHAPDKPHAYEQACLQVEQAWDGAQPSW